MNKVKKWIKSNKKRSIVLGVVLLAVILLIIFMIFILKFLMPNTKGSVYGDRCEVTKKYPVASDRKEKLDDFIKKYKDMKFVSIETKCNLIDVIIEVDDKVNLTTVKDMSKKMLEVFGEDELKYYDIQLMVRSNNDKSEVYPQIATHHKEINGESNAKFIW
jgi:hypothetical protein